VFAKLDEIVVHVLSPVGPELAAALDSARIHTKVTT
jgi:hypothetical protein